MAAFVVRREAGVGEDALTAAEPLPLTTAYSAPDTHVAADVVRPAADLQFSDAEAPAHAASELVDGETGAPSDGSTPWKTRRPPVSVKAANVDLAPQPNRWGMLRRFDPKAVGADAARALEAGARKFGDSSPHTPVAG